MENFIAILIGIAIFGYKMYTKSQKQEQTRQRKKVTHDIKDEQNPLVEKNEEFDSIDDYISNFLGGGGNKENTVDEFEQEVRVAAVDEVKIAPVDVLDDLQSIEYTPREDLKLEIADIDENEDEQLREDELADFELRKAVIYSEILQQKYF